MDPCVVTLWSYRHLEYERVFEVSDVTFIADISRRCENQNRVPPESLDLAGERLPVESLLHSKGRHWTDCVLLHEGFTWPIGDFQRNCEMDIEIALPANSARDSATLSVDERTNRER